MPAPRRIVGLLVLAITVSGLVGCDFVSKRYAQDRYAGREPAPVISGILDLRYVENRDVAFRALRWIPAEYRKPLVLAMVGASIVALCAAILFLRRGTLGERAALVLVLAGAAGNFLDRATLGYVIDFIDFGFWPTFNLADVYLSAGGIVLFVWGRRLLNEKTWARPLPPSLE